MPKPNLCAKMLHLSPVGNKSRRHDMPVMTSTSAAGCQQPQLAAAGYQKTQLAAAGYQKAQLAAAGYQQTQLAAAMYGNTKPFSSKAVQSIVTAATLCSGTTIKRKYINSSMHERRGHYYSSISASRIAMTSSKMSYTQQETHGKFRLINNMTTRGFATARPYEEFTPPTLEDYDLISPTEECPINTAPFKIHTDDGEPFLNRVSADKKICKHFLQTEMRRIFAHYEAALKVRGLVSPYLLSDDLSNGLHDAYTGIKNHVVYLTAYDFSVNISGMPRKSKREFLDYLCDEQVIVTRDWKSMNTSVTYTKHDLGTKRHRDGTSMYKGECDASYSDPATGGDGTARIAVILWDGDQVVWCEILKDIPCDNSTEAEALGMCLLLKRAIQLNILQLEVCTDCAIVDKVVRGDQVYTQNDKNAELYDLLRALRGNFIELLCRWTPREGLTFVDGLSKIEQTFRRKRTLDVVSRRLTHENHAESVLSVWAPILSGGPIFSVKERGSNLRNMAKKKPKLPEEYLKLHRVCHHAVGEDEMDKVNALWHIIRGVKPSKVSIRMKSEESVEKIQLSFGVEENDTVVVDEGFCTLGLALEEAEVLQRDLIERKATKCLNIIWDAELFDNNQPLPSLTIVFAAPHQKSIVEKLDEFSPVSIASFNKL